MSRLDYLVRSRLWAQILVAMVLGVGTGLLLSPTGGALVSPATADIAAAWFALPGRLFLAMIQMVVVPLVVTSIIMGIAAGGSAHFLKRIGVVIGPYFVATTAVAVGLGATLALLLRPGRYIPREAVSGTLQDAGPAAAAGMSIPDRLVAIIPANPGSAIMHLEMFQVVVFAILMAVALSSIAGDRARPILALCESLQEVSMKVVSWAMALAPAAVFGLLAQVAVQVGFDALLGMSAYVGTVLLGLAALLLLAATTVGASIGAPSTPGVGIVILATIVQGLGVPPEGIALIIGVDRLLDMARTAVNVSGDLTACTVVDRWIRTR